MLKYYYSFITENDFQRDWQSHLAALPSPIQEHCLRFQQIKDKQKRTLAYTLLQKVICNENLPSDSLTTLIRKPNHKPLFHSIGYHFSISYSKDICAVAIADRPIGMDIEFCDLNLSLEHYQDVFNASVWAEIIQQTNAHELFFYYWTQMEALFKKMGIGMVGALKNAYYFKEYASLDGKKHQMKSFTLESEYTSSVCCENHQDLSIQKC